jgi:hypothetical protein
MDIGGYEWLLYYRLFVAILFMAIGGISICGYCWLFFYTPLMVFFVWLLMVILLMVINDYFVNGYWWLFY